MNPVHRAWITAASSSLSGWPLLLSAWAITWLVSAWIAASRAAASGWRWAYSQLGRELPPLALLVVQVGEPGCHRRQQFVRGGGLLGQGAQGGQLTGAVLLEHRQEQVLFGGEVRIQRAHGEPGLLSDRVHRRPGVAVAGEDTHRGGDQRRAGALAALLAGEPGAGRNSCHSVHYSDSDRYCQVLGGSPAHGRQRMLQGDALGRPATSRPQGGKNRTS